MPVRADACLIVYMVCPMIERAHTPSPARPAIRIGWAYTRRTMADFTLRPMEPGDGPEIDALMRNEAQTTAMSLTTHYRHEIYQALLAQHPGLFGVVATSPSTDGLDDRIRPPTWRT